MSGEKEVRQYGDTARQRHPNCVICGTDDRLNLGLRFEIGSDNCVSVFFPKGSEFQGHPGQLHGGIIATLFDAAMMHCLFARGLTGVTAELKVRYRHPVTAESSARVRAWITKQKLQYAVLDGTLHQDGVLKASARSMFHVEGVTGESTS